MKNCIVIGSGKMATRLATTLFRKGTRIHQVYSPTPAHAAKLAKKVQAQAVSQLGNITDGDYLYIISVTDDALPALAHSVNFPSGIIVHTAGTIGMEILAQVSPHYGILYPLQTFSATSRTTFSHVPVCLEASDTATLDFLKNIATLLTSDIREISSAERKILHLAAVFACNFPNALYTIAHNILSEHGLPFSILHPLIMETATKATRMNPHDAQTGPAFRNDLNIINTHQEMLSGTPEFRKLYELLSEAIIALHKPENLPHE
ncbi:MAG: DUF2520 domain-containing protein [Lentimicrobiaceae bacterium]|nr:DUF2520 domain-containing protein [Lentimicrobiaceae bacterium]